MVLPSSVDEDVMCFQSACMDYALLMSIVFDSGATISVSPCKEDFFHGKSFVLEINFLMD